MKEISIDKKYRTRDGRDVEIIAISKKLLFPVVGIIEDSETTDEWSILGEYYADKQVSSLDLIEVNPYADFKVDDKVLVKHNSLYYKKHFAGLEKSTGFPMVFMYGQSSYTNKNTQLEVHRNVIRWEDRTDDMVICDD